MPTCCGQNYDRVFNRRNAERELRRYRRQGPKGATGRLVTALLSRLPPEPSLLDIGGGVGVIQHELAAAGAASVTAVDASGPYLEVVHTEARRRGYGRRHGQHEGDFVEISDTVETADVVTLDKVICCYPDMPRLVRASAEKAKSLYGIVVPIEGAILRAAFRTLNVGLRVFRCEFEVFLHRHREIDAVAERAGLRLVHAESGVIWSVRVYARP
ncbi:MAG: methyltransferase domain-containing protein [Myxococcota bacterium]